MKSTRLRPDLVGLSLRSFIEITLYKLGESQQAISSLSWRSTNLSSMLCSLLEPCYVGLTTLCKLTTYLSSPASTCVPTSMHPDVTLLAPPLSAPCYVRLTTLRKFTNGQTWKALQKYILDFSISFCYRGGSTQESNANFEIFRAGQRRNVSIFSIPGKRLLDFGFFEADFSAKRGKNLWLLNLLYLFIR